MTAASEMRALSVVGQRERSAAYAAEERARLVRKRLLEKEIRRSIRKIVQDEWMPSIAAAAQEGRTILTLSLGYSDDDRVRLIQKHGVQPLKDLGYKVRPSNDHRYCRKAERSREFSFLQVSW